MTKFEAAANIAFFLLEKTGSVFGYWSGTMSAAEQKALFGTFLGKGKIHLDGEKETIEHSVTVCFGTDYEITFSSILANLDAALTRFAEIKAEEKARREMMKARREARLAGNF
jgi:hypothetical protein